MARIEVTVPHSLGILAATRKLQEYALQLQYSPNPNQGFKLIEADFHALQNALEFIVEAAGKQIKGVITIAPNYVNLVTDDLPLLPLVSHAVALYYSSQIKSQLTKILS